MIFNDLSKKVFAMSKSERVIAARQSANDILNETKYYLTLEQNAGLILMLIQLFVGADGRCSVEEYNHVCSICDLNMSYDAFYEAVKYGANPVFVSQMDQLIDSLPASCKLNICLFGLYILAADDIITDAERELFIRILS